MSTPGLSPQPWFTFGGPVSPAESFGAEGGFERRRVTIPSGIPFTGRLSGIGLGGHDWQRVWPDGTTEIEARYAMRTDDDELVEIVSSGIRSGPPDALSALSRDEPVDPALLYFRTVIRLTAGSDRLREFTRRLFVGVGRREPDAVYLDAYALD